VPWTIRFTDVNGVHVIGKKTRPNR
jgi:hypothetical protein